MRWPYAGSTSPGKRKTGRGLVMAFLFAALVVGSVYANSTELVVFADIELLPTAGYTQMADDDDCGKPASSVDLMVICVGGWSRYRLTGVTRVDGKRLEDTVALIYSDPVLGGRWKLVLERLGRSEAHKYGASFKAVSASRAGDIGGKR